MYRLLTIKYKCVGVFTFVLGDELRLQVVTVATSETDGYERFMRSARLFDLDVEVSFTVYIVQGLRCTWTQHT